MRLGAPVAVAVGDVAGLVDDVQRRHAEERGDQQVCLVDTFEGGLDETFRGEAGAA